MKKLVWLGSMLVLLLCIAGITRFESGSVLGARIMAEAEADTYWGQENANSSTLTLMGEVLPRNVESGVTFLPQSVEEKDWQGALGVTGSGNALFLVEDEYLYDKENAVRENHAFRYVILNTHNQVTGRGYLVATGLTMVSWQLDEPIIWADQMHGGVWEGEYQGRVTVFDPYNQGAYTVTNCRMDSWIRGHSTKFADKKSFKMKLLSEEGQNLNRSFCGLREDNSWILNGMSKDESRIREMSALQLWEQLAQDNPANPGSTRMAYVELVADGQYLGLYALQEPVDRKQVGAGAEDILYKSGGHRWPDGEEWNILLDAEWPQEECVPSEEGGTVWQTEDTFYTRDPDMLKVEDYTVKFKLEHSQNPWAESWGPLRNFTGLMNRKETTLEEVEALCNISNITDNELYRQLVFGWDNLTNNTYYYAKKTEDGYTISYLPWDMDYTFGNGWWVCYNDGTMNSTANLVLGRDVACRDGYEVDTQLPETAQKERGNAETKARWEELRQGCFAWQNIEKILSANQSVLENSGAAVRESERWPVQEGSLNYASLEEILEYTDLRLRNLDAYYAALEE